MSVLLHAPSSSRLPPIVHLLSWAHIELTWNFRGEPAEIELLIYSSAFYASSFWYFVMRLFQTTAVVEPRQLSLWQRVWTSRQKKMLIGIWKAGGRILSNPSPFLLLSFYLIIPRSRRMTPAKRESTYLQGGWYLGPVKSLYHLVAWYWAWQLQ